MKTTQTRARSLTANCSRDAKALNSKMGDYVTRSGIVKQVEMTPEQAQEVIRRLGRHVVAIAGTYRWVKEDGSVDQEDRFLQSRSALPPLETSGS